MSVFSFRHFDLDKYNEVKFNITLTIGTIKMTQRALNGVKIGVDEISANISICAKKIHLFFVRDKLIDSS